MTIRRWAVAALAVLGLHGTTRLRDDRTAGYVPFPR